MRGIVVLLLALCLGAAVVGAAVTGLFSLALLSLVLLLGTGAGALTLQGSRGARRYSASSPEEAAVIPLGSRRWAQGGGEVRRAA